MSNPLRKIKRESETKELDNIRKVYGKKPKIMCPKCHKKSLFMTNKDGNIFCVRCDSIVGIKEK